MGLAQDQLLLLDQARLCLDNKTVTHHDQLIFCNAMNCDQCILEE